MAGQVVLLNFWASMYAARARIALAVKEIKYECKEDDLFDKSPLLLQMNPIHKKIPVLIHNGKPICESLTIVQYIDEVWNQEYPLLPSDPYRRAQARFWADFVDQKIAGNGWNCWTTKGEEQEKAKIGLVEGLKVLENELGDKDFFGGDSFGYVDVALVGFQPWFYTYERFAKFSMEAEFPKLFSWVKRCLEKDSVSKSLADPNKVYDFVPVVQKKLGVQ